VANYRDYLASDAWRQLRSQARERAGHRCECCGMSADHVHHVRYPKHGHWQDDQLSNLLVLCASCHAKQHGIRKEIMKEMKAIAIDGYRLGCTLHEGQTVVRYEDTMLAFGYRPEHIHGKRWDACASQMVEGSHYFILENPFTRQHEPFLNHAGIGITAAGHCRDASMKNRIVQAMADAWQREVNGASLPPAQQFADDPEMAFLGQLFQTLAKARSEAKEAKVAALEAKQGAEIALASAERHEQAIGRLDNTLEELQQDVRDFITARRFCADNRIPSGVREKNINRLGWRTTQICTSEGIRYLPKARQDGDWPANCYPRDVLARAAREIGLLH
jgi:hypothetical protein